MWEIFFNKPIHEDSYAMKETLINLPLLTQTDYSSLRKKSVMQTNQLLMKYDIVKMWLK